MINYPPRSPERGTTFYYAISLAYEFRTEFRQSGALENAGPRETKFSLMTNPAVRSISQRSPQILAILSARNSRRELCPRAKWRRERDWQATLSVINPLILLSQKFARVRIPRWNPNRCKERPARPLVLQASCPSSPREDGFSASRSTSLLVKSLETGAT